MKQKRPKKSFDPAELKTMPHNEDAELAVLAGILNNNRVLDSVNEIIIEDDFYYSRNREIFSIMNELYADNQTVDIITVKSKSESKGLGIDIAYFAKIAEYITYTGIESHCKIIMEKSLLRRIITSSYEAMQKAYEEPEDMDDFVQSLEQGVFQIIKHKKSEDESVLARNLIADTLDRLGELRKNPGHVSGLECGLRDVDSMTTGFHKQDYIILAGRPGAGKTSLAINFSHNIALKVGQPVLFFSLEMSKEQIMERLFCSAARTNHHLMRQGMSSKDEWTRLTSKVTELSNLSFLINDSAAITLNFLRSKIRKAKVDYPNLAFVVIDYVQLMSYPDAENREQQVSTISRGIKALCKEIDIPILVLSQMNRESEKRSDPTPRLSDLRESGTLEQDADIVLFVWQTGEIGTGRGKPMPAKIKIAKQRNGPVGTVDALFFGESMRFEDKIDA